jgi:hypothetical protein
MTTDVSLVVILDTMPRIAPETSRGRGKIPIRIKERGRRCKWDKAGWTSPTWLTFEREHPSWLVSFPFWIIL